MLFTEADVERVRAVRACGLLSRRNLHKPRPQSFYRPTQTFFGVRHAFLPHGRLLNRKMNSFPIVRKYQLVITVGAVEVKVLTSQTHTYKLSRV